MPATAIVPLEIHDLRPLAGPNLWFNRPAWEFRLSSDGLDEASLGDLARHLHDALREAAAVPRFGTSPLPPIVLQTANRFSSANAPPPPLAAALLAELSLGLQHLSGSPVTASALAEGNGADGWIVAVEFEEEPLGRASIETARLLMERASRREPLAWDDTLEQFRELATELRLGLTTGSLVAAARERSIPHLRLDAESLVQLGHGRRQRRIRMAATDATGHVANWIAVDKALTKRLLSGIGIPVPAGRPVANADDACQAAAELGWPVVVKPQDADYGNGASLHLTDIAQVRAAYARARRWSERVLVERFISGALHRLLVVRNRLVAAVRLGPARVVGDSRRSIREMIDRANADPRRGDRYPYPLRCLDPGPEELTFLSEQGWTLDSIPPAGVTVPLRRDVFWSRGGTIDDVTDLVHASIVQEAIDTALVVGLDVAGIDVIASDIARPLAEQGGAVLEINAEPCIALHMPPYSYPPRSVPSAIVEMLFPGGDEGRIPVIAIVGAARCKTALHEVSQEIAMLCGNQGIATGHATDQGAWLDGHPLSGATGALRDNVQSLWRHPRTAAAVIELSLEDIVNAGLPFDRCDMVVVTSLDDKSFDYNECVGRIVRRPFDEDHLRPARNPKGIGQSPTAPALESLFNTLGVPHGQVIILGNRSVACIADGIIDAIQRTGGEPGEAVYLLHNPESQLEG